MAVRFEYEWHNGTAATATNCAGPPSREFDENGLMAKRYASINDAPILEAERRIF